MPYKYDFQLGLSVATLQILPRLGIPFPTDWGYLPYAKQETRGNGQIATFGFPTAFWRWETIAQYQIERILHYFDSDTDASKTVYIITYSDRGSTLNTITRQAIMIRPTDESGKSLVSRSRPSNTNYTDLLLSFRSLESP